MCKKHDHDILGEECPVCKNECTCNYHKGMGPNLKCPVHGKKRTYREYKPLTQKVGPMSKDGTTIEIKTKFDVDSNMIIQEEKTVKMFFRTLWALPIAVISYPFLVCACSFFGIVFIALPLFLLVQVSMYPLTGESKEIEEGFEMLIMPIWAPIVFWYEIIRYGKSDILGI